jgi:hypothetical protein
MNSNTPASTNGNSSDLRKQATRLASSSNEGELRQVFDKLSDASFLNELDSPEDYQAPATELRVATVVQTLAQNRNPKAQQTLVELTKSPAFTASRSRVHLLVLALIEVRPSPEPAIRFWQQHSKQDSVLRHVTVNAIADNGSPPAIALLGQILSDESRPQSERILWFRDPVLRHRTEPEMLRMADGLIRGPAPSALRCALVEALTDYRPQWYLECEPPVPGDWLKAPSQSKEIARPLLDWVLKNLPLDERQTVTVKQTLKITGGEASGSNR